MSFIKWLDHIDRTIFVFIQHHTYSLLDPVMLLLRNPLTWIPLYAFMLYYSFRFGWKTALAFIGMTLLTFAITDSLAAQVLKPFFNRLRPCHDPEMAVYLRGLIDCGGLYGMPSNHAANHFGLAAFWYYTIRMLNGKKWIWLWFWAAAICYAQVYVGKHYPFDTLVGACLGFLTGLGISYCFKRIHQRIPI